MTAVASTEKLTVDPELARLEKEDAAAWGSYDEAVRLGLSSRLRRSRFGLALATLKRLTSYELAHSGEGAGGAD